MQTQISHESFESLVGETVELNAGEVTFQAEVEAVNLLRQQPGQERQPFSVVMQSHDGRNHGQQMYRLDHPNLQFEHLFLVPIGENERGIRYEMVFN